MRILIYLLLFLVVNFIQGQETFLKSYNIHKEKKINNNYWLAKFLTSNKKVKSYDDNFILMQMDYQDFLKAEKAAQKREVIKNAVIGELDDFKGVLKFEENIVYVTEVKRSKEKPKEENKEQIASFEANQQTKDNNKLYFYELENGQTLRLGYRSFALNTLTIPVKYRFKGRIKEIEKDVSASISGVLHGGITWGWTSFTHRQGTVNETNDWNLTFGPILGVSVVTLNSKNTLGEVLEDTETINKGLVSTGFGLTFTFNKFAGGVFYGWDYAVGDLSNNWYYNKRPWVGVGIGFSLFK